LPLVVPSGPVLVFEVLLAFDAREEQFGSSGPDTAERETPLRRAGNLGFDGGGDVRLKDRGVELIGVARAADLVQIAETSVSVMGEVLPLVILRLAPTPLTAMLPPRFVNEKDNRPSEGAAIHSGIAARSDACLMARTCEPSLR
jgi:hypothetical protein